MSLKNFLYDYLIPPGVIKFNQKVSGKKRKPIDQSYFNPKVFHSNEQFKNKHNGERCFILASGPSIKTQDLSCIYGETCIAVSHFHLHPEINKLKPQYHVLSPQHPPFNFKDSSKYFEDFKKYYAEIQPSIFVGVSRYEYNYINLINSKPDLLVPNLFYLNYEKHIDLNENNQNDENIWDITQCLFTQRTVLYGAIQIAIYMGFKEIYLLGADHDYLNDTSRTTNHHFYAEEKGISDKNHLEQFTSEKWFFEYYMRWKQYRLMKEHGEKIGINIYNATEGGMLDVFERVSLKDLKL